MQYHLFHKQNAFKHVVLNTSFLPLSHLYLCITYIEKLESALNLSLLCVSKLP